MLEARASELKSPSGMASPALWYCDCSAQRLGWMCLINSKMADRGLDFVEEYDDGPEGYENDDPEPLGWNFEQGIVNPAYTGVLPDGVYDMGKDEAGKKDQGYMAVKASWLDEQWSLLETQPWFRGHMNRDQAIRELTGKPGGSFVARVSSQPGRYAISVIQRGGNIEHMLILPSYAGAESVAPGKTQYRIGTYSKLVFNTVPKLVAYYIGHPYIGTHSLRGDVNPESQEGGYMLVSPN
eukprot:m.228326 g.228326  ORF g.228326 m.228326 type:complete len:239 (+) comp11728_c0_seq1:45-761(+)